MTPDASAALTDTADVVVIGAGAAGLATGIFVGENAPHLRVCCIDGARSIGAKILVSGGSRCNVTNVAVTERDFWGGSPRVVRQVLRAFPSERTAEWFDSLGVRLHVEDEGKLFPDSNSSRTVLEALLREASRVGVRVDCGRRVVGVAAHGDGFVVDASARSYRARAVVLATGGLSLPKSGSDGFGYEIARRLGHGYVETTPALVPLVLASGPYAELAGISHRAALTLRADGRTLTRLDGSLLWTHFGISGPVALNMSRHWHRARLEQQRVELFVNVCPGETFESIDEWLLEQARARARARVATVLATRVPAGVAAAWTRAAALDDGVTVAHLTRESRRALAHALVARRLDVTDSRGYQYAEVTAGGVPLDEIDPATMESRRCHGLYLVGEVLDVDGRLGGFNFQWAWSSAWVAGHAITRALD
jgi:predicted Rossmann fold flavoprotein